MALKPPVQISHNVAILLGAIMILFAGASFYGFPDPQPGDKAILFRTSRMPSGEHFINFRIRTAPAWLYQGLHALPAIIWSIAMPLQHSEKLRKKWPVFHRKMGYIILSLSLVLSMTGYVFLVKKHTYSHENIFHMHSIRNFPIKWPTFDFATWLLGPPYWITLYKTAATARAKNFVQHRKWAVLHTLWAYIISAERLGVLVIYAIGFAVSSFPQDLVHEYLGVGYTNEEMAEAELAVFALANPMAVGFVFSWWAYEFGLVTYLRGVWKQYPPFSSAEMDMKKVE
ncbi:hypothetical protein LLEC1_07106 [Akanthomyces lecanii]|uniref:Uncharacterized protein n=1 Tax=Cordyceps confragosa TaxID=2714763 RepID=A0A179IMY9_CORDF|nr:hypothetical protein LLEC1_07106 [Akanthomyces lecanii]